MRFASAGVVSLVLMALSLGDAAAEDRRFAVVVGFNGSDDPELQHLAYADDDAMRYSQLLGHMAERVVLLTELDKESRALWGSSPTQLPTRDAVMEAIRDVRRDMAKARAEGDRAILYFVYSGHGNYDAEGKGYVHLRDGRFTTRDLYGHVIGSGSTEEPVVLIVDACNASLLVHSRGSRRRRVASTSLKLENYPHVGVILASSSVGETHEWGKYLSGIFSHEVRSGLLGAADVDDDGRITFAELAAFVASANEQVTNPTVRLTPYIRPPLSAPGLALIDLNTARFPARVRIDDEIAGKAHLVNRDLLRIADFNRAQGHSFWLAIPNGSAHALVHNDTEYVVPPGAQGDLQLAQLDKRDRAQVSSRGAGSRYFERTLFQESYGADYARRYLHEDYVRELEVIRFEELPWYENSKAWVAVSAGLAALATGGVLHGQAVDTRHQALSSPWASERARLNGELERYESSAWLAASVGTAALLGGALWFTLDLPLVEERYQPPLRVQLGPNGLRLEASFD
jgi:hypothetical protein